MHLISSFSRYLSERPYRQQCFIGILVVYAAILLAYSNSFQADWHYDDFHHIKENINIRKASNIPVFFKDPTTFSRNPGTNMYRPLLMTTHAINYQMGIWHKSNGYYILWYHVTNFLFHVIASLAVFAIVLWIFSHRISIQGVHPVLIATFAGLFFGLHTINTETIVYISSRSSGMAAMFTFWAFYHYFKASDELKTKAGPLLLSAFLYLCGLMSKEIAITLPVMLIYYEFLLNRHWMKGLTPGPVFTKIAYRLMPYAFSTAFYLWVRHILKGENLLSILTRTGGTKAAPNLTAQLATQSRVAIYYIREWLWPTSLSIDKPFKVSLGFSEPKVVISLIILAAIIAGTLRIRNRAPLITFGTLWFFTALLPTSLFRLNIVMNDHRLYLSGLGGTLLVSFVAAWLFSHYLKLDEKRLRIFCAICIATLILMGLGTFKRNMAFATEETMWKDVILKDRKSVRGYNNLGIWYEQNGEYEKALAHYQQTIKLAPMFPNPYINIGNVYHKQKKFEPAEKWMKRALQLDPNSALASYNLGNILREAGKMKEAIAAYTRALQLNPRYIEAANNLANIYFKTRNYEEAIKYYERALFIDPTFAMSYYNIALASERLGNNEVAVENFEKFLRFWLGDPKYRNLAQKKIETLKKRQ
jgi:Tfp pilus assembly protein PilF